MKDENLLVFLDNHKWHPDKEIVKRVSPSIWLIRGWGFLWCICWKGHQVGLHIISHATSTTIYLCFKILLWGPQIKYKHSHLMLNIRIPPFSISIYWVGKKKKKTTLEWHPRENWCQDVGARADWGNRITESSAHDRGEWAQKTNNEP